MAFWGVISMQRRLLAGYLLFASCWTTQAILAQSVAENPFQSIAPAEDEAGPIAKALGSRLPEKGFDFQNVTLDYVAQTISEHYGIPERVDHVELEKIGLEGGDTYSLKLKRGTLRSGLIGTLKQWDLTYVVGDDELAITSIGKMLVEAGVDLTKAGSAISVFTFEGEPTPVFYAERRSESSKRIRKVLREPLTSKGLEFADAPLSEVLDFIHSEYEIEVALDLKALDDLGLSPNEPVTVNLRSITLGAALRILLRQLDLTYTVRDEVLLIQSEDAAISNPITAVYPVMDLLEANVRETKADALKRLVDVVMAAAPDHGWDGQTGSIEAVQPGLIVISDTQSAHEQFQHLLAAMRQARDHKFDPSVQDSNKGE
jgi:hypothetical protein